MSNIVKWGSYDAETAQEEKSQMDSSSTEFFKVKVGKSVVRFLPPPLGKKSPFRVVWTHYINLPGSKDPISFACPMREANRSCPVCQKAEGFKRSGNDADFKKALDLFPKRRVYANIVDREHPEKGVQVFGFGKTIHEALAKIRADEDAGGDFTNPDTGFDIIVEREGTGKNDTNYTVMAARKQSKLGDYELISQQHDLERFAKVLSEEEILTKLSGGGGNGGGGRTERELNSGRSAPKNAPKGRGVMDDAEEDDPFP